MTRRLLVIGNALAGTTDQASMDRAVEVLRTGAEVEVAMTGSLDELVEVVSGRADDAELVVVGGDGSMHALAQAIHQTGQDGAPPPVVGLIPLGTGNDFARAVNIPPDPAAAARIVLDGPLEEIDVIEDERAEIAVNVVHIGVGEEAARIAAPWKEALGRIRLGPVGYVIGGISAGIGQRGRYLEVIADDIPLADGRRRVLQVVVAVGTSVGGGTRLAPEAEPDDGKVEVIVSFAVAPLRRLRYALHLSRGEHTRLDDVVHAQAREVTVRGLRNEFGINADGELSDPVTERTWRVVPSAYRLHVPSRRGSTRVDGPPFPGRKG
ncbi:diacylglycerol kinase family protein [Janibacter alkaliphilus]|uniref:YegS/Rv2252/BmrU family lipid kinase n=1 Tax=Janibacter alkaliphilus TaxID=1069963 RepID=A0A852X0C0_9MICO|nr:YegS/Rv2252/BmrU family lipid kinase [Janibacter alkaliphilus]